MLDCLHYLLTIYTIYTVYTIYSVSTLSTLSTDRYPGVGCEPHPGVAGVLPLLLQLLLQVGVDKLHGPAHLPGGLSPLSVNEGVLLLGGRSEGEVERGGLPAGQEVGEGD